MKHRWDTKKAKELYDQGAPDGAISRILGITKTPIQKWRTEQGLPPVTDYRFWTGMKR